MSPFNILKNSTENETILIIFGAGNAEETSQQQSIKLSRTSPK